MPWLSVYKSVAHTKVPSHFSDPCLLFEKTSSERLSNWLQVSKVVSDKARIQVRAIWFQKPSNSPLYNISAQHLATYLSKHCSEVKVWMLHILWYNAGCWRKLRGQSPIPYPSILPFGHILVSSPGKEVGNMQFAIHCEEVASK